MVREKLFEGHAHGTYCAVVEDIWGHLNSQHSMHCANVNEVRVIGTLQLKEHFVNLVLDIWQKYLNGLMNSLGRW